MQIDQILAQIQALPVEQLLKMNKLLVETIRQKRKFEAAKIGMSFNVGDVVRFDAKRKGIKYIQISGFNRAGPAVVGKEINPTTKEINPLGSRWTVANTLCSKV